MEFVSTISFRKIFIFIKKLIQLFRCHFFYLNIKKTTYQKHHIHLVFKKWGIFSIPVYKKISEALNRGTLIRYFFYEKYPKM